jgi:ubiquitin-conjugating enzyme E2 variant
MIDRNDPVESALPSELVPRSKAHRSTPLEALPAHDEFSTSTRVLETTSILTALVLLILLMVRCLPLIMSHPASLLVWILGVVAADFGSGMIHWFADTWGHETMPILGRRLLRPFRVHHLNPDDFLRRDFIDCNGDVALLQIPILALALFLMDRVSWGGALGTFCMGLCGVGMFTNQFHQWAHQRSPAPIIRWLQRRGVVLSPAQHRLHHRQPHQQAYCITTGWCNTPLEKIGFFSRLERLITRFTGRQPRADYLEFISRHPVGHRRRCRGRVNLDGTYLAPNGQEAG